MPPKKVVVKRRPQKNTVQKVARKEVKLALNRELETKKFFTRQNTALNVTYSGLSINVLEDPASATFLTQGTARNQFLGDTIDPVSLLIRYNMHATISASSFCTYRVMVVQAKGGGFPAAANVLQSVGNFMTPYSDIDPIYQDTFTVLYDRIHMFVQTDKNAGHGTIYIPSRRLRKISFTGASATTMSNNAIALLVYTDYAPLGSALFGYHTTLSFKDA